MKYIISFIIAILIIFLFVQLVEAQSIQAMHRAIINKKHQAAGDASCDWSTSDIGWNGEHTSGAAYWCKADDSSVLGVLNGATITTDPDAVYGEVLLIDASLDFFSVAVTASEIGSAAGFVKFLVRTNNQSASSTNLWEYYYDAQNYIDCYLNISEQINLRLESNNVIVSIYNGGGVTIGTWDTVHVAWNTAGSLHGEAAGVEMGYCIGGNCGTPGAGDWAYESDSDNATTFATEPDSFRVGDDTDKFQDDVYMVNFELYNTDSP